MGSTDRARRLASGLALLAASLPPGAQAATTGTCSIVVQSAGTLTPNAALTTLGTQNPGGSPARASITASAGGVLPGTLCLIGLPLNCMQVSISAPSGFSSAPTGGGTNVSFAGAFSQVGSSSLLNLASLIILNGTYQFTFDLTATKTAGSFRSGTYQATQTIRCE